MMLHALKWTGHQAFFDAAMRIMMGWQCAQTDIEPAFSILLSGVAACGQIMIETTTANDEWNAGHLACGELVIELRKRLRKMPGDVIKVTALDPAAPIDIGAWCNMTGNTLIKMNWDTREFWIRSKTTW